MYERPELGILVKRMANVQVVEVTRQGLNKRRDGKIGMCRMQEVRGLVCVGYRLGR
jgi:hypothetical protein